jgi:hypothetical protein
MRAKTLMLCFLAVAVLITDCASPPPVTPTLEQDIGHVLESKGRLIEHLAVPDAGADTGAVEGAAFPPSG